MSRLEWGPVAEVVLLLTCPAGPHKGRGAHRSPAGGFENLRPGVCDPHASLRQVPFWVADPDQGVRLGRNGERSDMRLTKIGLVVLMLIATTCGGLGCTADQGFQKGVLDGVAGAISALIKIPVENWVKATFPAA